MSNVLEPIIKKFNIKLPFKKLYYYVPPCPACGSYCTGRFVRQRGDYTNSWMQLESLKHGEIIHVLPELTDDETAFCARCGHRWNAEIKTFFLTPDELEAEKKDRQTNDLYAVAKEEFDAEEKQKRMKRGGLINLFAGFIGHL